MSMIVDLVCRPNTLNEAKLADRIAEAVAKILSEHGGSSSTAHQHLISTYTSGETWSDGGEQVHLDGYVHLDGAPVPKVRQVTRE